MFKNLSRQVSYSCATFHATERQKPPARTLTVYRASSLRTWIPNLLSEDKLKAPLSSRTGLGVDHMPPFRLNVFYDCIAVPKG